VNVEESFYQLVREIRKDSRTDPKNPGGKNKKNKFPQCSVL